MRKIFQMRLFNSNQDGTVAVLITVLIVVIIGIAALTFDIGSVASAKNELQNIADSAVLAAAGELGNMYAPLSYDEQQVFICDPTNIISIAQQVGQNNSTSNPTGGQSVTIPPGDIVVGTWNPSAANPFTPTLNQPDAVRVTVRRDSAANGPISTLFARIFNIDTVNVTATATAALTGQGTSGKGDQQLPIGIPSFRLDSGDQCGQDIVFSPPTDPYACAGWTDLEDDASVTPNGIESILDGSVDSPYLEVGQSAATFNNGKLNVQVFEAFMLLYYEEGFDIDETGKARLDADKNPVLALDNPAFDPTQGTPNGAGPAMAIYEDGCKLSCAGGCPATCEHGAPHAKYPPCGGGSGNCSGDLRYDHVWHSGVVVFEGNTCTPNTTYPLAGFVQAEIYNVIGPSEKMAVAKILCNSVAQNPSRGGGGSYGLKGSIPGLVQ